jgi:hypothetical protein
MTFPPGSAGPTVELLKWLGEVTGLGDTLLTLARQRHPELKQPDAAVENPDGPKVWRT